MIPSSVKTRTLWFSSAQCATSAQSFADRNARSTFAHTIASHSPCRSVSHGPRSGRFHGVISAETSRSSKDPTISHSFDSACLAADSAWTRCETFPSCPCVSETREPTTARTGTTVVILPTGSPLRPGQPTHTNHPYSNGWTLLEDASFRWRIDLLTASPKLADTCIEAYVERPASHAERWSDHAPVTAVFDLDQLL